MNCIVFDEIWKKNYILKNEGYFFRKHPLAGKSPPATGIHIFDLQENQQKKKKKKIKIAY